VVRAAGREDQQNQRVASSRIGAHAAGSMRTEEPGGGEQRADKRPFTMFDPCPELAAYKRF